MLAAGAASAATCCACCAAGRRLLRPAAGRCRVRAGGATWFNPSYYVFPAFPLLAQAVPDPAWVRLAADGLSLLRLARFGRWHLPPDWLQVARRDGGAGAGRAGRRGSPSMRCGCRSGWPGRGCGRNRRCCGRIGSGRASAPPPPAWVDLGTDLPAPYPASAGLLAVARLVAPDGGTGPLHPLTRDIVESPDYYAAMLILLSGRGFTGRSGPRGTRESD